MMGIARFSYPVALLLTMAVLPLIYGFHRVNQAQPRGRRPRMPVLLILRVAAALLLVLALGGVQIGMGRMDAATVFVLDRSESVAGAEEADAIRYMRLITGGSGASEEAGIVTFASEAYIEQPLRRTLRDFDIQSSLDNTGTDIAKGLGLARSMLASRPASRRRIVLLSDGNQTAGDAMAEAAAAAAEGIDVDVLPLATEAETGKRSLFLEEVAGPQRVRLAEPFDLRIVLRGSAGRDVAMRLYRDGTLVSETTHRLAAAASEVVRLHDRIESQGLHQFRVTVRSASPSGGEEADEAGWVVFAAGTPRVLHIGENPAQFLDGIMRRQGYEVAAVAPGRAPQTLRELSPYDVVILDNAPADALGGSRMKAIAEHVERFGGGLIMIGGTASFGPGGYSGTPVEEVLPVEMALKKREKKPALAVVLVLDKSGSMGTEQRKISKLEMAKDAAIQLAGLLTPEDSLGIIAFDRSPVEVLPLGPGAGRERAEAAIRGLTAGGGTAISPAVQLAYRWLNASPAERKHILLLSDGQADPADRSSLVKRAEASAAVLSAVGIGADVDREFLGLLARTAHGRIYFTETGADLPDIFKREAMAISGDWVAEGVFHPRAGAHEILREALQGGFPEIGGYIVTTPRKGSEVAVSVEGGDPVLCGWRYGLGRTLVFASDLSSPWTRRLAGWEHFPSIWTQMVRWTQRGLQSENLHPEIVPGGQSAILAIDAFDPAGRFINSLNLRARVRYPDAKAAEIGLAQTAPGRYEGRFELHGKGTYLCAVTGGGGAAGADSSLQFGFDLSRSAENRQQSADWPFLAVLAATANGRVLDRSIPKLDDGRRLPAYADAWQAAALLALAVFLVEMAARRSGWIMRAGRR